MKLPLHSYRNAIIDADGWTVAHVATGNLPLAVICERAESLANAANLLPELVAELQWVVAAFKANGYFLRDVPRIEERLALATGGK